MSRRRRSFAGGLLLALAAPLVAAAPPPEEPSRRIEIRRVAPAHAFAFVAGRDELLRLPGGPRGYLGVHVVELTPELRAFFGADPKLGILISRVEPSSPASAGGLQVGDVMTRVDGAPVVSGWDLRRLVAPRREGDRVAVDVVRERRALRLQVRVEEREGALLEVGELLERDGADVRLLPREVSIEVVGLEEGAPAEVEEAVRHLRSPDVQARIEAELASRRALEARLKLLERRIRELEKALARERDHD